MCKVKKIEFLKSYCSEYLQMNMKVVKQLTFRLMTCGKCVILLYLLAVFGALNILLLFLFHEPVRLEEPSFSQLTINLEEIPTVTKLSNLTKYVSLALINGDNVTLASLEGDIRKFLSDEAVLNRTADCNDYFKYHVQASPYSSKVNYSIAFSHMIHFQIGIFEMFMATSYRVEDTHCIFIDSKVSETFRRAAEGIVNCYKEIFLKYIDLVSPPNNVVKVHLGKYYKGLMGALILFKKEIGLRTTSSYITTTYFHKSTCIVYMKCADYGHRLKDCETCGSLFFQRGTYPVVWGHVSLLDAHMDCLASVLNLNKDWEFFLDTAGSELPFAPIDNIKSILMNAPGSIIESYYLKDQDRLYTSAGAKRSSLQSPMSLVLDVKSYSKLPTPFNLTIQKGSVNVALKRDYANYLVTDKVVLDFYNWMYDMVIPEESFFSTLITIDKNENGTLTQNLNKNTTHGLCVRKSLWFYPNCTGQDIRSICNFGIHDLKIAKMDNCMIGNKFNLDVSASAVLLQTLELFGSNESWAIDVKKIISPE